MEIDTERLAKIEATLDKICKHLGVDDAAEKSASKNKSKQEIRADYFREMILKKQKHV